jgi:hypothetical protein
MLIKNPTKANNTTRVQVAIIEEGMVFVKDSLEHRAVAVKQVPSEAISSSFSYFLLMANSERAVLLAVSCALAYHTNRCIPPTKKVTRGDFHSSLDAVIMPNHKAKDSEAKTPRNSRSNPFLCSKHPSSQIVAFAGSPRKYVL